MEIIGITFPSSFFLRIIITGLSIHLLLLLLLLLTIMIMISFFLIMIWGQGLCKACVASSQSLSYPTVTGRGPGGGRGLIGNCLIPVLMSSPPPLSHHQSSYYQTRRGQGRREEEEMLALKDFFLFHPGLVWWIQLTNKISTKAQSYCRKCFTQKDLPRMFNIQIDWRLLFNIDSHALIVIS